MGCAAVMHFVSDFTEGKIFVNDNFFYPVNFLTDVIFFNRITMYGRKKGY